MSLDNVGGEIVNAAFDEFFKNEGILNNLQEQKITCESSMYGLMLLSSEIWSDVEREREKIPEQVETNALTILWSLVIVLVISLIKMRGKKNKKW